MSKSKVIWDESGFSSGAGYTVWECPSCGVSDPRNHDKKCGLVNKDGLVERLRDPDAEDLMILVSEAADALEQMQEQEKFWFETSEAYQAEIDRLQSRLKDIDLWEWHHQLEEMRQRAERAEAQLRNLEPNRATKEPITQLTELVGRLRDCQGHYGAGIEKLIDEAADALEQLMKEKEDATQLHSASNVDDTKSVQSIEGVRSGEHSVAGLVERLRAVTCRAEYVCHEAADALEQMKEEADYQLRCRNANLKAYSEMRQRAERAEAMLLEIHNSEATALEQMQEERDVALRSEAFNLKKTVEANQRADNAEADCDRLLAFKKMDDAEIERLRDALRKIDQMWGEAAVHEIARAALWEKP